MSRLRQAVSIASILMLLVTLGCAAICAAPQPPCHKHTVAKACDSDAVPQETVELPALEPSVSPLPVLLAAGPAVSRPAAAVPPFIRPPVSVLRI